MNLIENEQFFENNFLKVRSGLSDEDFLKFSNLNINEERYKFVNNLESTQKFLTNNQEISGKNLELGYEFKKKGNSEFQKQDWIEALKNYNRSYVVTPSENSPEISIILANRSAALLHMKKYKLVLKDIEQAFSLGYPSELQYKLHERKAKSMITLKLHTEALGAFRELLKSLDKANLPKEKIFKQQKEIRDIITNMEQNSKPIQTVENNSLNHSSSNFLNSSVIIASNDSEGRFAMAGQDIKVSEVIMEEKPFCAVVLGSFSRVICQKCFKRTIAPISCRSCSDVVFCSTECLQKSQFHRFECGFLQLLPFWRQGSSITCHMALRIISEKTEEYFKKIESDLKDDLIFEDTKNLPISDYRRIYNLVSHEKDRNSEDLFYNSLMACFLTKILISKNFFKSNENINFIGSLILRNLLFSQFNAHEISELQIISKEEIGKSVFIGGALYTNLALFNHSCDPGIVRYFNGANVCVRAIKNIKKGEIIAENYGPHFTSVPINRRKAQLKEHYWFDCACRACEESWPLFEEMDEKLIRFKCNSKKIGCSNILLIPEKDFLTKEMVKCNKCNEHCNIFKALKALQDSEVLFRLANSLLDDGKTEQALNKFVEMFVIMDETVAMPFKEFYLCQQGIKQCLLEIGKKYHSITDLQYAFFDK